VFVKALEGMNLMPESCWAVGDNLEWDVAGPQKMGIFGIWNDFRKMGLTEDSEVKPDRIINSIQELMFK
jgi:putative hydrolase of the HAD superfamily